MEKMSDWESGDTREESLKFLHRLLGDLVENL
jgi:hypothetical protein